MECNRQTQCVLDSTLLKVYWDEMAAALATVISMFLYGFYLNLFMVALYTLAHRKTAGKRVLLAFTWAMAVMGTTQMSLRLATSFMAGHLLLRFIQQGTSFDAPTTPTFGVTYLSLNLTQNAIFVINNFVTDSLFLYRCYMIWGSQWKVVVFPGLLVLSTCGCVSVMSSTGQTLQQVPYIMAAITNLVLLFLTAGRIWWIRRGRSAHWYHCTERSLQQSHSNDS
ncbi:hypothetical protein B0H14DRAFT_1610921 [Mycena olivaceomarginata]|nr:hypothetical protein B0H14DRAFT_1610921 [Mycena olivaceomarginata]